MFNIEPICNICHEKIEDDVYVIDSKKFHEHCIEKYIEQENLNKEQIIIKKLVRLFV